MMIMHTGILFHPNQLSVHCFDIDYVIHKMIINSKFTYFGCLTFTFFCNIPVYRYLNEYE